MKKIICDICGTVYPENAEKCPICGHGANTEPEAEIPAPAEEEPPREIFDYEAGEGYQDTQDKGDYDEKDVELPEDFEQPEKTHTLLIIFLIVSIVAMIGIMGFLTVRYLLPNRILPAVQETTAQATETVTPADETTVPEIPCTSLILANGKARLSREGQYWLIHASVFPADTTDRLTYVAVDEDVCTVDENGRITATGEGETFVVVTCGTQQLTCPVVVSYAEETEPAEETVALFTGSDPEAEESADETEPSPETEPSSETTEAATEPATAPAEVELKLKKSDISFGKKGITFTLELDCDLKPEDVTWTSSNGGIVRVDNGVLTTLGNGVATITAEYQGQKAQCIVRCSFK